MANNTPTVSKVVEEENKNKNYKFTGKHAQCTLPHESHEAAFSFHFLPSDSRYKRLSETISCLLGGGVSGRASSGPSM